LVESLRLKSEACVFEFFQPHCGPGVDSEMSTRNIIWGIKGGWCVGRKTLPPSRADCFEIWEPQSPGIQKGPPGLYRDCFIFTHTAEIIVLADISPKLHKVIQQTNFISICKTLRRYCAIFTLSLLRVFMVSGGSSVLAALPVRRESKRTNLIQVLEGTFGYHVPYVNKVVESLFHSIAVNVRFSFILFVRSLRNSSLFFQVMVLKLKAP
jgi:hypothetical protein